MTHMVYLTQGLAYGGVEDLNIQTIVPSVPVTPEG